MNKNDNINPCAKNYSRVTLNLWTIRVFDMDVMIDEDKNENN